MNARRASSLLLGVVQAATGVYLIVYLVRWQWNRAVICGVLFVATEVLLVGKLVLQRLRAIEARLDDVAAPSHAAEARLAASRPEPADRFAWLRESTTRTNVFLPVLLGAGVLASAAAWAVEGIARRTARPAFERSLAGDLGRLAFPVGGFLGGPLPIAPTRPRGRRVLVFFVSVCLVLGIGLLVDVLADATQTRPEAVDADAMTVVDLHFRGERGAADPARHASALVGACTADFRRPIETLGLTHLGDATVRVVLDADLGNTGGTRLRGCLEDTTIDGVQATVASLTTVSPE